MPRAIWKFPLHADATAIDVTEDAKVLHVQAQNGIPCVWVEVTPTIPLNKTILIMIYSTGHDMPDNPGKYIGTFQMDNGNLVFYAYET